MPSSEPTPRKRLRHPVETFRVKAWFNAVSIRSGKTAYGLELEFARPESILRFEEGTVQRPSLWDKYARGEITPGRDKLSVAAQRPNLVDRVDARYAGSAAWLRHPFWAALLLPSLPVKKSTPLEMLAGWMARLDGLASALLFATPAPTSDTPFRRQAVDFRCLDRLTDLGTLDGAGALMLLLREAMLFQDAQRYEQILRELHHYDSWFAAWPETAPFYQDLLGYIDRRFGNLSLPDGNLGWRQLRRDWTLHQDHWWTARRPPRADPNEDEQS